MKKQFLAITLIMFTLALQACSSNPVDKLNGVWDCDMDTTVKEFMKAAGASSEQASSMFKSDMFKNITLTIDSAKKEISMSMAGQEQKSTFEIISEKDGVFSVHIERINTEIALGKNSKGEDTLSMNIPGLGGSQKLFFVKAK